MKIPVIRPSYEIFEPLGARAYGPGDPRGPLEGRLEQLLEKAEAGAGFQRLVSQTAQCFDALARANVERGPATIPRTEALGRCWAVMHRAEVALQALEAAGSELGRHGLFLVEQWVRAVGWLSSLEADSGIAIYRADQLLRTVQALEFFDGFLHRLLGKVGDAPGRDRLLRKVESTQTRIRVLGSAARTAATASTVDRRG